MQLRRFNDAGIAAFHDYLNRLRNEPSLPPPAPAALLEHPDLSEPLDPPIEAAPRAFNNRMEFARWLHDAARQADADIPRRDAGFWAWLTLALFDEVCPVDGRGMRKPKEDARYLPELTSSRRYYRHAIFGPYMVFINAGDFDEQVVPLLCGSLSKLNDEAYRLFVENSLAIVPSAVKILYDFYYDPVHSQIKRGAQTKKAGSIRRLVRVLTQYSRTYDLDLVPANHLRDMLPSEFNRWRDGVSMFA